MNGQARLSRGEPHFQASSETRTIIRANPRLRRRPSAIAAAAAAWVMLVLPAHVAAQGVSPSRQIDYEKVLYSQPRLIDEVMATILPPDPAEPNTYFVGFGAWAEQDVFIREVAQARDVVDERLRSHGRSLLLVNHRTAVEEVPLATVTNLDLVLGRLGHIMRPDKDALILFLTSHGVENLLGVQFQGFPLNHLTPPRLADMLARSRIRNRIVIISACHSGSFIRSLQHPTTMVITAARADRASFGCSNENDWTYFGNAFFNYALRATTSLPQAFAKAKVMISAWEAKDKFLPSEPQIFIGQDIGPVLVHLERLPLGKALAPAN